MEAGEKTRDPDERLFFTAFPVNSPPSSANCGAGTLPVKSGRYSLIQFGKLKWAAKQLRDTVVADTDEEIARGTAFLLIPVLMAAGALTYFALPAEPSFLPVSLGVLVLSIFAYLARGRFALKLAIASALLFVCGMLAGKIETWRTGTMMLGSPVTTRVFGTVRALEYLDGGRVRLTIAVKSTERPRLHYQPDRVRVSARAIPAKIRPGSGITGLVRLFPARGPLTPDGYDFAFESYFDGIGANGFFLGSPRLANAFSEAGIAGHIDETIENIRLDIYERITAVLPGESGEIAAALITGLKRGISASTNDALRRTGLAHILSISGLHMALVAGTIMGALRLCFAFFPGFSSRHPVKKYSAATAIVAGLAYLLLSGGGVATQRSFIMLAVMLLALLHDHAAITMRNLAIAAIMMIAIAPHDVAGPSFQMSFAATAALVAAYGAWTEFRFRRRVQADQGTVSPIRTVVTYPLRYAGGLALTSIVAGSATAIFAAYHFHRIAPLGLPANLVALPVFSTLVMPPAVVAMVLMPFDLEAPALHLMGLGISLVTGIAGWFSRHTAGDVTGIIPAGALGCMTVALVLLVVPTTKWRFAAIPFLVAGAIVLFNRRLPDVMVSEDARLVAVRTQDGSLAVNVPRPNDFVISDWEKSSGLGEWVPPENAGKQVRLLSESRFFCANGLCLMGTHEGEVVAYVADKAHLGEGCARASVVIIADPSAPDRCAEPGRVVLTARRLALFGTAFVFIGKHGKYGAGTLQPNHAEIGSTGPPSSAYPAEITIRHAISSDNRPWNRVRVYLPHARGLRDHN